MTDRVNGSDCVVIGANGLVGKSIAGAMSARNIPWAGTSYKRAVSGLSRLDITDADCVRGFFADRKPKCVFLAANLAGGVNFCEADPEAARAFHLDATSRIADIAASNGACLVYISTDYVFDGKTEAYAEDDAVNPLNVYGHMKLAAEEYVQKNLKSYIIVRTTNIFGWDPDTATPNYIMQLYRSCRDRKKFNAPSFLWGNPTYVGDLAGAIFGLYVKGITGLFHVAGKSFINRLEWANEACDALGLDKSLVAEVKDPPADAVPRPMKSRLITKKFESVCNSPLHDVGVSMKLMKFDMEKKSFKRLP
ncbi:MAG: SDR family oxidoreductase [Candidatus Omnitrophota bacterium]